MLNPIHEECRDKLTAERAELQASIADLGDTDPGLTEMLQESLAELEVALAKLADGRYGTCETCRGSVGSARLYEMPAARLCVDCADAAEA